MTKTQANEPGFVLVPREPTEAMLDAYWEQSGESREMRGRTHSSAKRYFASMLAAAPLVPSPAYGGVREALEPFAKEAEGWSEATPNDFEFRSANFLTVGDLRRARAAYDALSPVAVEEADAKEGEPASDATIGRDFLNAIEASRSEYPWLADWTPAERYGELIGDLLDIAFPSRAASADAVRDAVRKALLFSNWAAGEGICSSNPSIADPDDFMGSLYTTGDETPEAMVNATLSALAAAPSTPSPQIGNAGAGPVGEDDLTDAIADSFDEGWTARDGAKAVMALLAARPVEEPGEMERLTRERDEARALEAHETAVREEACRRADAAEAALAETREELACTLEELIDHTGDDMIDSRQKRVNELREAGPLPSRRERWERLETSVRPFVEGVITSFSLEDDIPDGARGTISVTMGEVRAIRAAFTGDAQGAGK